jgi:hypothetical protein
MAISTYNADRGRQLVETTGTYQQDKMVDSMDVLEWIQQNRDHVSRHGCCPGGCERQLIPHAHGYAVCPQTYEPCQKRRVDLILQHLGVINGSYGK